MVDASLFSRSSKPFPAAHLDREVCSDADPCAHVVCKRFQAYSSRRFYTPDDDDEGEGEERAVAISSVMYCTSF